MVSMALCGVLWAYIGNIMGYSRNKWNSMEITYWKSSAGIICWVMKIRSYVGVDCQSFDPQPSRKSQLNPFILLTVTVSPTVIESVSLVHAISF